MIADEREHVFDSEANTTTSLDTDRISKFCLLLAGNRPSVRIATNHSLRLLAPSSAFGRLRSFTCRFAWSGGQRGGRFECI